MNRDNNRSAAGLRRSAIAERIRLREEWSELKGTDDSTTQPQNGKNKTVTNILKKNLYKNALNKRENCQTAQSKKDDFIKSMQANSEVLHGVVALVEVGMESKALALRAALTALGATVVPTWSPLVTHLVWSQGGCRATRAKARALASRLVSPLWVEACAAAARRLPEQAFPAAARASDLPSPRTLRQLLKKAEMENIPILDLLSDKEDDRENRPARLRLSSETDNDTSADTSRDTSKDTSRDKSTDKSRDTTTDIESRVNTAPRRALPNSTSTGTPRPSKSKRKLFTQKEGEVLRKADEDSEEETPVQKRGKPVTVTPRDRKELARAERMARKLVAACAATNSQKPTSQSTISPRVVLTGMDRGERQAVCAAIRTLNGRVQSQVTRRTTHVLLGSFTRSHSPSHTCSGVTALNNSKTSTTSSNITKSTNNVVNTSPRRVTRTSMNTCSGVTGFNSSKTSNTTLNVTKSTNHMMNTSPRHVKSNCSGVTALNVTKPSTSNMLNTSSKLTSPKVISSGTRLNIVFNKSPKSVNNVINTSDEMRVVHRSELQKARTLNALVGAARGCRVLYAQWALDSLEAKTWLHHHGYEVPHLKKISQKARIERTALGKLRSEYAYDVFYGMRVRMTPDADQKDAATQLLTLCGAVVQNGGDAVPQNGGLTQNGVRTDVDLTVGVRDGEVSSKWVFDSVAAARMRTTRRYINNRTTQNTQGNAR